MKVIVKVTKGDDGCTLDVPETTKILDLKKQIQKELKVPVALQMLVLYGETLVNERTIASYNQYPKLEDCAKLELIIKEPDTLKMVLYRSLLKFYTQEQAIVITSEFMNHLYEKIRTLNLDDLERIATEYIKEDDL